MQERVINGRFASVEDVYNWVALKRDALKLLVKAGAFGRLGVTRRAAFSDLVPWRMPGRLDSVLS